MLDGEKKNVFFVLCVFPPIHVVRSHASGDVYAARKKYAAARDKTCLRRYKNTQGRVYANITRLACSTCLSASKRDINQNFIRLVFSHVFLPKSVIVVVIASPKWAQVNSNPVNHYDLKQWSSAGWLRLNFRPSKLRDLILLEKF